MSFERLTIPSHAIPSFFSWLIVIFVSIVASLLCFVGYHSWKTPPRAVTVPPSTIQADALRGYANQRNLDVVFPFGVNQEFRLITNGQGARRSESQESVSDPSILVVGDSQSWGWGIDYTSTYSHFLETQLAQPVLNVGVPGYGTVSAMLMAEEFLELGPKIVILGFYYDHIKRSVSSCYPGFMLSCLTVPHVVIETDHGPKVAPPSDNTKVLEHERAYYNYMSGKSGEYSMLSDFYWTARRLLADTFHSSSWMFGRREPSVEEQVTVAEFLLKKLVQTVRRNKARLVIVYIPDYFKEQVISPPSYLVEITDRLNIDFVDMTGEFQQAMDDGRSIQVPNDGHLNEVGHRLIGQKLLQHIRVFENGNINFR